MRLRAGIDIGGTFTDVFLIDVESGRFWTDKRLTSVDDPARAVLDGLSELLGIARACGADVAALVHGTTLVSNAVIERRGAKTALITTAGFEDVLEIGREMRYDVYDLFLDVPEPIVPRPLRRGVRERVSADGAARLALDEGACTALAADFARAGVEAVAICFLHAFRNDAHERRCAELIALVLPEVSISRSSEVLPEIREYERTSATVLNAYVQPLMREYLGRVERGVGERGIGGTLQIMLSSGRLCDVASAQRFPIRLVESGAAGGAMAGAWWSRILGRDVVSFDVGGTTAKAALIVDGRPAITTDCEVARLDRFKRGSGLPCPLPVVDLIEIGAGGGSIAHVDALGLLRVGPHSAAGRPGPACYGFGGTEPTVTDADAALGYLNARSFLGGRLKLDLEAARSAIERTIAQPLGISVEEAAAGIRRTVDANMANAARIFLTEKGADPRALPLLAFGGAGPVHARAVAALLRVPIVIVPRAAGVQSALGFLAAPVAYEFTRSYMAPLERLDWAVPNALFEDMEHEGRQRLAAAGVAPEATRVERLAQMRYVGQGHEIVVSLPLARLGPDALGEVRDRFFAAYERTYGRAVRDIAVEVLTWRTIVAGPDPPLHLDAQDMDVSVASQAAGERAIYLPDERAFQDVPVYQRTALAPGFRAEGPAIVEDAAGTIVVDGPGSIEVDAHGNVVVTLGAA